MKFFLFSFLLLTSINSFAAQISSNEFTIQLEYNKHTNLKDFNVKISGSCEAYSMLGSTDCWVDNNKISARRDSENAYYVPGFKFKSQTDGFLISSYKMFSEIYLINKDRSQSAGLYTISSEKKNLDLTNEIRKYFDETLYITTIPTFDFKSLGKLKSSKVTTSKLKPENMNLSLAYSLLNDREEVIKTTKWVKINSKVDQDVLVSNAEEQMLATKIKPSSLKAELTYSVTYFGKVKSIKKVYSFSDLDNIDLASKINEVKIEIEDENLE